MRADARQESGIQGGHPTSGWDIARLRLAQNESAYRKAKVVGSPQMPQGISIAITARCNSRCRMCSIWRLVLEQPDLVEREMTIDEISGYLKDPMLRDLVEIDLTGGEPHLREDLVQVVEALVELKRSALPRLRTIIIPSNGLLTDTIASNVKEILRILEGTGIDFVSVSSLDGVGAAHDLMRGRKGAFDAASTTIDRLLELKSQYPETYWPGIKTTITHLNVKEIEPLLNYAKDKGLFHIISAVIITSSRFRNKKSADELVLSTRDKSQVKQFYSMSDTGRDYYYRQALNSISNGRREWECTALFSYMFIDYDRKVYPCPIQDECVGDLTESSVSELLRSSRACEVRRNIGRYPLCQLCTEPGSVRYSAVTAGKALLDFLDEEGVPGYMNTIVGKGFDKLLGMDAALHAIEPLSDR